MTNPDVEGGEVPADGLSWTIKQVGPDDHAGRVLGRTGWFTASVTNGRHAGWALHEDLEAAKGKALLRLHYYEDMAAGRL